MNSIFTPPASNYKKDDFEGFIWIPKIHITHNDNEKNSNKGVIQHSDEHEPQPEDKPKESENPQFEDPNNNYIPAFFQKWKGKDGESAHFTILICYGMNEDMGHIYTWTRLLKDILHVNILCFDYSGYGLNKITRKNPKLDASVTDNISEKQIYQDTTNVYMYMIDTLKILPAQIILLGRYLGTGPVVHLVSKLKGKRTSSNLGKLKNSLIRLSKGEQDSLTIDPPAGIVLYSPITSVLKWVKLQTNVNTMFATDMFDNLSKASTIKVPWYVLNMDESKYGSYIVQGKKDPSFPATMGKSLQEKITSVWKYLEVDDVNEDEDDFLDTFLEFLDHLAPGKTAVVKTIAAPEDSVYVSSPFQVISRWLQQIKLEQYTDTFLTNGYFDLTLISTLEDIDLEAMGITDPIHRQAILDHARPQTNKTPTKPVAAHPVSIPPAETHPVHEQQPQTQQTSEPLAPSNNNEQRPTESHTTEASHSVQTSGGSDSHQPVTIPTVSQVTSPSIVKEPSPVLSTSPSPTPVPAPTPVEKPQPEVVSNTPWVAAKPQIIDQPAAIAPAIQYQKDTTPPSHSLLYLIFFILLLFTAAVEKHQ